jgi:hypothetical protein
VLRGRKQSEVTNILCRKCGSLVEKAAVLQLIGGQEEADVQRVA